MVKVTVRVLPTKANTKVAAKPQLSQRDRYAKAMGGATKRGGSNGIGVGK
jgi:hypothetical protein